MRYPRPPRQLLDPRRQVRAHVALAAVLSCAVSLQACGNAVERAPPHTPAAAGPDHEPGHGGASPASAAGRVRTTASADDGAKAIGHVPVHAAGHGSPDASSESAAASGPSIPLVAGLALVSVLQFPDGDRENVVEVAELTDEDVVYTWRFVETRGGVRVREGTFRREVRTEDLDRAPRLHTTYRTADRADYPGYTAFSLSRAAYRALRGSGSVEFSVTRPAAGPVLGGDAGDEALGALLGALAGPGALQSVERLRGTLVVASREPEAFPLLLDGRRVTVPALRLNGRFGADPSAAEIEFHVLADESHPLLLRIVEGADRWQLVRVQRPAAPGTTPAPTLERALDRDCRAELPGVFFDFGTADLHPRSRPILDEVARLLAERADWRIAIEGHTDDVGTDSANRRLSAARAAAVREHLERRGIAPGRLDERGHGASRPLEPNTSAEGRARNRRVELVRACP